MPLLTRHLFFDKQEAEALDGSRQRFLEDPWERDASSANAGYGKTAVLEGGALLEKVVLRSYLLCCLSLVCPLHIP